MRATHDMPAPSGTYAGDPHRCDPLDGYGTGAAFFLASPRRSLLARGLYATIADSRDGAPSPVGLPARTEALLKTAPRAGTDAPMAVGAIPFDGGSPPWLFIPTVVETAGRAAMDAPATRRPVQAPDMMEVVRRPSGIAYEQAVAAALERIRDGELRKVVVARTLDIQLAAPPDRRSLLRTLTAGNRDGYTFALDLPTPAAAPSHEPVARSLLGASPELLISKEGDRIVANPLAGSTARAEDPAVDRARADALRHSSKDRHEHAIVVEAVVAALRPFCTDIDCPGEPALEATETLWHLSTRIEGRLADPTTSSLALGLALHPTPAVCGTPTNAARAAIAELEAGPRGLFTGMIGWCDAAGDGEWVITIRCAEIAGRRVRLHAGAGVVAQSDPAAERAETATKFRTMLRALGIERDPEDA